MNDGSTDGGDSARGGEPGERSNGLSAATYRAVADLDPRLGAHLLDVLQVEEIAAYVKPAFDKEPLQSHRLPERPLDRLYVDSAHRQDGARLVKLAAESFAEDVRVVLLPVEPREPVADDEWADLVARMQTPGDVADVADEPAPPEPASPFRAVEVGGLTFLERRQPEPDPSRSEDEDHFEPPAPPPVPRLSITAKRGLIAIAVGVVLLLLPLVAGWSSSALLLTVAVGCIAGGAVALLSRLRDGPPQDDGWDDGAVL